MATTHISNTDFKSSHTPPSIPHLTTNKKFPIRSEMQVITMEITPIAEDETDFVTTNSCDASVRTSDTKIMKKRENGTESGDEIHEKLVEETTNQNDHEKDEPKLLKTKCPQCEKEISKKGLKRHINGRHTDAPQFFCNLCDFATKRNDQLQKHIKAIHFEPMSKGRPKKNVLKRSRSPFSIEEFNRRHSKTMRILNNVDELNDWKAQLKMEIMKQFDDKIKSKDAAINRLSQLNSLKDVEIGKLKIRVAILEQKSKSNDQPELNDISGLLNYLNLQKTLS